MIRPGPPARPARKTQLNAVISSNFYNNISSVVALFTFNNAPRLLRNNAKGTQMAHSHGKCSRTQGLVTNAFSDDPIAAIGGIGIKVNAQFLPLHCAMFDHDWPDSAGTDLAGTFNRRNVHLFSPCHTPFGTGSLTYEWNMRICANINLR